MFTLAALLSLSMLGPEPAPAAAPAKSFVIHAGNLLDVAKGVTRHEVTIVTQGEKVVEILDGYQQPGQGQSLIDLSAYTILPGLIDAHVHISEESTPNQQLERLTVGTPEWAIRSACYAQHTLLAGFTTVRDLGESGPGITLALKHAISNHLAAGPRIFSAGQAITTSGGYGTVGSELRTEFAPELGISAGVFNGVEGARAAVRAQRQNGADVIKVRLTEGLLAAPDRQAVIQLSPDELEAVVQTAHDYGMKVTVHAHGAPGIRRAIEAGVDSIEHATWADDEALALMKRKGIYLIPTMAPGDFLIGEAHPGGLYAKLDPDHAKALAAQVRNTVQRAYKAGVKIVFGTDAGIFPHGTNAREFPLLAGAGLPPIETVRSATTNAAELLGMAGRIGTVGKEAYADLIAVRGDPLSDLGLLGKVAFVMKGGEVYRQPNIPPPQCDLATTASQP